MDIQSLLAEESPCDDSCHTDQEEDGHHLGAGQQELLHLVEHMRVSREYSGYYCGQYHALVQQKQISREYSCHFCGQYYAHVQQNQTILCTCIRTADQ